MITENISPTGAIVSKEELAQMNTLFVRGLPYNYMDEFESIKNLEGKIYQRQGIGFLDIRAVSKTIDCISPRKNLAFLLIEFDPNDSIFSELPKTYSRRGHNTYSGDAVFIKRIILPDSFKKFESFINKY